MRLKRRRVVVGVLVVVVVGETGKEGEGGGEGGDIWAHLQQEKTQQSRVFGNTTIQGFRKCVQGVGRQVLGAKQGGGRGRLG